MIFRQIVLWSLGPSGIEILNWYVDHNLWVNGAAVLIAILAFIFPRQGAKVKDFVIQLWQKSPLGPSPEDRLAIDAAKARHKEAMAGRGKKKEK